HSFPTRRSSDLGWLATLRIEGIAEAVAEQVEREHGDEDRHAREEDEVRLGVVERDRVGEHAAPGHSRLTDRLPGNAHTKERERRLEQDVRRYQQRRVDEDRRDEIGQQLLDDDVRTARAEAAGGLHELAFSQGERLTAD